MNLRLGVVALAAVIATSTLLPAGAPLGPGVAWAQDAATDIARQRYKEGVTAFDAGKFEEARVAFLQAYALKRHPAVLLNLGLSELKSNHPTDGGNHLTQFLRESTDATPEQRQTAQNGVEEAKRKTGYLVITVDQANADVSIDGNLVGKSPLADPVFVEPGSRTVVATLEGKNATFAAQAKRGAATTVSLTIGGAGQPPPLPPPPLPPLPGSEPPPMVNPPPPNQPPPTTGGDKESFGSWYARKPLAWVGTGVTVVGLGVGIAFTVLAGSATDSANLAIQSIENKQAELGTEGKPCGPEDSNGSADQVDFAAECSALRSSLADYDADVAVATVGWVAFGVGLAGTVTYILVDYVAGGGAKTGSAATPLVVPVIAPGYQGAVLHGSF